MKNEWYNRKAKAREKWKQGRNVMFFLYLPFLLSLDEAGSVDYNNDSNIIIVANNQPCHNNCGYFISTFRMAFLCTVISFYIS